MFKVLRQSRPINASLLIGAFCVYLLVAYNYSFWSQLLLAYPLQLSNLPFLASIVLLILSLYYAVFTLFDFRYSLKPVLIFIAVGTMVAAYFMDRYGYIISSQTFNNVADTDSREVIDLVSFKLAYYVMFLIMLPCLIIIRTKVIYPTLKRQVIHVLIAATLIGANLALFNKSYVSFLRNHKQVRYYLNPLRPVYSLSKYIVQQLKQKGNTDFSILDPSPSLKAYAGKPRLVVLVVGESDRAANYSLNGYGRETNPLLSKTPGVYSFQQVSSCGTETTVSVPCMFSVFKRSDFTQERGRNTENALDLLQKAKVNVLWRDNDSGCKNVCDRVATDDFNNASIQPYCNSFECHDEVLLHDLQTYIKNTSGDKIIVLHKKGNHGPAYYKRYPQSFEKFTPVCNSSELQDCADQSIVNAYDNIVLYTDYFLHKLITQLAQDQEHSSAMIYVSDHGESLGENGIYLHAMPYWIAPKEQTHIPLIFWANQDFDLDSENLRKLQTKPYSHDNLFHTLLGLFKVQTPVYDRTLDMFGS